MKFFFMLSQSWTLFWLHIYRKTGGKNTENVIDEWTEQWCIDFACVHYKKPNFAFIEALFRFPRLWCKNGETWFYHIQRGKKIERKITWLISNGGNQIFLLYLYIITLKSSKSQTSLKYYYSNIWCMLVWFDIRFTEVVSTISVNILQETSMHAFLYLNE